MSYQSKFQTIYNKIVDTGIILTCESCLKLTDSQPSKFTMLGIFKGHKMNTNTKNNNNNNNKIIDINEKIKNMLCHEKCLNPKPTVSWSFV